MSKPVYMVLQMKEDGLIIANIKRIDAYAESEFGNSAEIVYGNCKYITRQTVLEIATLLHAVDSGMSHLMKEGHKNHIGYYKGELCWLTPGMIAEMDKDHKPKEAKIRPIK